MEFSEVLNKRRTHRHFLEDPVEKEVLDAILHAATRAPSAGFTQASRFLVLTNPEAREKFWSIVATPQWREKSKSHAGLDNAPVLIIPFSNQSAYIDRYQREDKRYAQKKVESDFPSPYWTIDTAFAAMLIQLAIVDAGLAYLFFGLPVDSSLLLEAFNIPSIYEPIGIIALGHPANNDPSASSKVQVRLHQDELIWMNDFKC